MLLLEVDDAEILVFYKPPDSGPSVGGYLGVVGPGGSFKGLDYDRLLDLGPGWHDVPVVETASSHRGMVPLEQTEDDRLFRELRHALFQYEVGARVAWEMCDAASRAMTPGNQARVARLLGSDRWRRLYGHARAAIKPT
jgi:hypothetical protein